MRKEVTAVEKYMMKFWAEYRGTNEITAPIDAELGLEIKTHDRRQTNPDGKRKFETGRETVTLRIKRGTNIIDLAILREGPDESFVFTDLGLKAYPEILPLLQFKE